MGTISERTRSVGEMATVDLSSYFSDPDGDALSYTAASSNARVVGVSVSGSSVAITALARGLVTVTVTARDPGGMSASSRFGFDPLLSWNRWWLRKRLNQGLLSYGSHAAANPFDEPALRSVRTAGYESGMDDSPMYEGVPFNPGKNTLELQDVGLTSLYVADCLALADLARELGRTADAEELARRAMRFSGALDRPPCSIR